jgi:hypothetical protein
MEGISFLTQRMFSWYETFADPPPHEFNVIELASFGIPISMMAGDSRNLRTADDLCTWLSGVEGTLRLARISHHDGALFISKSHFMRTLESIKADPLVKYMVCCDYDGFHEFHTPGFRLTRFLGTAYYALLWTFDPVSLSTAAIFIERRPDKFRPFVDILAAFTKLLHTPWMLSFVSNYFLLTEFDRSAGGWELEMLRTVEKQTGFGPHPLFTWRSTEPVTVARRWNIDQLTGWLQGVNEVAINAKNRARHLKEMRAMLERFREEQKGGEIHGIGNGEALQRYQVSADTLFEAIPCVDRQMSACMEYFDYLKDRSEKLANVVSCPCQC